MSRVSVLVVVSATLLCGACQRPKEVREVARLSKPIVVGIQQSGSRLETRMGLQTSALELRAASLSAQEAAARAHAKAIEREFRLLGDKESIRRLEVIRESDAQLLADPLAPVRAAAATRGGGPAPVKIDLSPLTKSVAALDRLAGATRLNYKDLGLFVVDVNSELEKLEKEAADSGGNEAPAASQPN